ncbi:hypothetical protein [Cohnella sp.]|uniref:hypothetical protein n=1 Tax=Cohnella sp. TaxID=1883426 RepID=UPI0035618285
MTKVKWATSTPKSSKVIKVEIDHWWMRARMHRNEMDTIEEFFPHRGRYRELWSDHWKKRCHAVLMAQTLHVELSAAERREAGEEVRTHENQS